MIQLHRLEGFYRVAVAGSYTRAAKDFPYPITQPGVHQQVKKLEAELGRKLFQRVGRDRVELTAAGRRMFEFCEPFFLELPRVARNISQGKFGGTLRIDAAALEIRHVMPRLVKRLRAARPDIEIELVEVPTADLSRLTKNQADLVIDYVPALPRGFAAKEIGRHYVFVVVPADGARRPKRLSPKQLSGKPFVSFHPSMPHCEMQLRALTQAGVEPKRILSASSTEAILGFVAAGLGYSLIPWPTEDGPRLPGVVALRQRGPGTEFPILATFCDRKEPDPVVAAALDAFTS